MVTCHAPAGVEQHQRDTTQRLPGRLGIEEGRSTSLDMVESVAVFMTFVAFHSNRIIPKPCGSNSFGSARVAEYCGAVQNVATEGQNLNDLSARFAKIEMFTICSPRRAIQTAPGYYSDEDGSQERTFF